MRVIRRRDDDAIDSSSHLVEHPSEIGEQLWGLGHLASGIGVVLAGPSPTGSTLIDVFLIIIGVSFSIVVVASAPWTRKWPGSWRPVIVAAALGVVFQVAARLGNIWHFGVSSAIAIVPILLLTLLATQWRDERQALRLWAVGGGLLAATVLALLGFGVAAAAAVGFINCTASIGGFFGPKIIGELSQRTDSFRSGFVFMIACWTIASVLVLLCPRERAR